MKYKLDLDRIKFHLPLLYAFAGEALLLFAWRIPGIIQWKYNKIAIYSLLIVWIAVAVAFVYFDIYKKHSHRITTRYAILLTLFGLSVFPFRLDLYRSIPAQTASLIGLALMVYGILKYEPFQPTLRFVSSIVKKHRLITPKRFIWRAFFLFLAITIFLSWYCFDFHPSYTDSTSQYVHGKFVASGHLFYIKGHALPEFFFVWLMVHGGKWYSQYPPLHQTLLGIGHMLNAPWIINPLEGALTLLAVYAIAKRAYGESTARLACVLMFFSPFVVLMSSEFMNHSSALLFATVLIFCYGKFLDAQALGEEQRQKMYLWAAAVGLSAGCAFLSRPLTGIGTSAPVMLHVLYRLWKNTAFNLKPFLIMAACGGVCILFQMWFNYETTGDPLVYAYTRYHSNSLASAMGFYKDSGIFTTLHKMQKDWYWLNINLFEWSLPCTFFVLLVCLRPVKSLTTRLLIGIVVSQTIANMFNQFSSTVFGPRYMYEISTALIILTALGIMQVPLTLRSMQLRLPQRQAVQGMIALCMLMVFATGLVKHFPQKIKDFTHFFDSHPDFIASMEKQSEPPALIFVGRYDEKKKPSDPAAKFRWTAWNQPPTDDAPIIYAYDRGDERNMKLIRHYPHRKAYVEMNNKLIHVQGTPLADHPEEQGKP